MLLNEQIEQNKKDFISLLQEIKVDRPDAAVDALINKLQSSDFFIAPASVKYHANYKGGLCHHSLNVYKHLCQLAGGIYPKSTLIIVALLHDISKMNLYEISYRNKKEYSETGSKSDAGGRFDWVVEQSYAMVDEKERFIFGNHEETSEFMVRTFIPLQVEESAAILYHHGGKGWDSSQAASLVFGRYKLAVMLHCADMMAAYADENE